jgi:hypothetical protein
MLTFTTTETGFMGTDGSDLFVPRKNPEVTGKWRSVYIHGKAQDIAGYDIPSIIDGVLDYKPEQECIVALKDQNVECILVAWYARCGTMPDPDVEVIRGLICAKDDEASLVYARKCQAEKKSIL